MIQPGGRMKKISVLILLVYLLPSPLFAKIVSIDSKIFDSGKKIGSPRVTNTIGEKSKVVMKDINSGRDYNLEVITKKTSGEKVNLQYRLSIRDDNDELINRGSVKISKTSMARVYIDRGRVELRFKLTKNGEVSSSL